MPRPRKKLVTENTEVSNPPVSPEVRTRSRRMSTPAFMTLFAIMTLLVLGAAIFVGRSDRGQIDVNAAIQNANQLNRELYGENAVQVNTVPEELRNLPNGGLVPQENQPADPPPAPPQTASTTDPNASTTPAEGTDGEQSGASDAAAEDESSADQSEGSEEAAQAVADSETGGN